MNASTACDILTARPIAPRGAHDRARGAIENSISAARAAVAAGYAIECDVQISSDGEVFVFHDDDLDRLTGRQGRADALRAEELTRIPLLGATETIPLFVDFLAAVDGKTPLVVELKSRFDGDVALARRVAEIIARCDTPLVVESFDPAPIAFLRKHGAEFGIAHVPLGIVGMARCAEDEDFKNVSAGQCARMEHFLHYSETRPDFLSWYLRDLPHAIPLLCREALKIPVTVWTVRSPSDAKRAMSWADQIVFEGFLP
jgi:glycerophosphoryl diester phosphodiesterase